jgi:hypothetical protein
VTDLIPPPLAMWVFAGAGAGALLTWMTMRVAGGNAYQHGFDHGRSEIEHELAQRITALEHERDQLREALAHVRQERARPYGLPAPAAPAGAGDGPPGPAGG